MTKGKQMLKLCNITKNYLSGDSTVAALRGVDLEFRQNEFVSILGPSGCGKTTLLNIIGGLDHYTDGDLIINGISTKDYTDRDWDHYRNHSIGFVFQTYNLITHQTVLSNVELALTLSGVSKAERRRRAKEALELVGLGDQLKKKPNQMSGGQMQRVAIARALVNDPDILLADEPTGALDSETSIQVMDLLKQVAEKRLVIMVTHNPELAQQYSTRIIRVLDGKVMDDSAPYCADADAVPLPFSKEGSVGDGAPDGPQIVGDGAPTSRKKKDAKPTKKKRRKGNSMSLWTAAGLSFNNLMTKKTRTILTSFAGSIGIIGIALILSLSTGINAFIDDVQEDTLSSYPIELQAQTTDMSAFLETMAGTQEKIENQDPDRIYTNTILQDLVNSSKSAGITTNNLKDFKVWMENEKNGVQQYLSAVQYQYAVDLNVYSKDAAGKITQVNPSTVLEQIFGGNSSMGGMMNMMSQGGAEIWTQMIEGENGEQVSDLIKDQYLLVGEQSRWPQKYDEIVLIVDQNNQINDLFLYSLGLKDQDEIADLMNKNFNSDEIVEVEQLSWSIDELLGLKYQLILPTDKYQKNAESGVWEDKSDNPDYMSLKIAGGVTLKVVGVIKPNPDAMASSLQGAVGYTAALTEYYLDAIAKTDIVKQQLADPKVDVLTGLPFATGNEPELTEAQKAAEIKDYIKSLSVKKKAELYRQVAATPSQEELEAMVDAQMAQLSTREAMENAILGAISQSSGMDAATVKMYLAQMSDEELAQSLRKSITEELTKKYGEEAAAGIEQMTDKQKAAALVNMLDWKSDKDLAVWWENHMPPKYSDADYETVCETLGLVDKNDPSAILLYAATFEDKDAMAERIEQYNKSAAEEDVITYTDYVALMMSSITIIINIISYVLMAFVSISLVVSSIMIGIITYISVLERTREIGILRAIGASKKDIARVFNAEALAVGLTAGLIGVGLTVLLNIPISLIVRRLADINTLTATLPPLGAVILVGISVLLTFIAGLIPSRIAARKDPVEALRTE